MSNISLLTHDQQLLQFHLVHRDTYEYPEKVINNSSKIKIICKLHGEFFQTPNKHKQGRGCPKCGVEKSSLVKINSYEENLKDFYFVHGVRYLYPYFGNIGNRNIINVICIKHGLFSCSIDLHKRGRGCSTCCKEKRQKLRCKSYKYYTDLFNKVHNNYYTYPFFEFKKAKDFIEIICPIHGIFKQTIDCHKKSGCDTCANSKISTSWKHSEWQKAADESKYFDSFKVYIIECFNDDEKFIKIGRTFTTVSKRFARTEKPTL